MIATITLNPSLDQHITVDGLVVDGTNRWSRLHRYAGGKGIDVSRAVHEMEGRTVAYGFIGGPVGRAVEILLDEEEVPFSFTPIHRETRTNFIITDSKTSKQTRIDAPGPHISKSEFERFQRKMLRMRPSPDLIVMGGSLPPGIPSDVYYSMIMEAKTFGVRAILDSDAQWLAEGIKAKPYLVKPNVREAEGLLGRELATEDAIIKAALDIVDMGVKIAVISRGSEGIIAATSKEVLKAIPPEVKVRSAVGAGDCTIAGLALKLANEESLSKACRLAVALGTAAVLTPGTELARRSDVEALLPQVKIKRITPSRLSQIISGR
ncbi:MAG: 1-phosphofructokinase [Deltaproteobacteria bacterium]|nr:1-phosphofructokinase [Deltaproteobacteria bacterium]